MKDEEFDGALKRAKDALKVAKQENKKLQEEVDSLWVMIDEMTKSDVQKHADLLKDLESDALIRSLMITKKKVDC